MLVTNFQKNVQIAKRKKYCFDFDKMLDVRSYRMKKFKEYAET